MRGQLALALAPALPALAAAQDGPVGIAAVQAFASDAGITIHESGPAAPYPSTIEVAGVPGEIADLDVRLQGFRHLTPAAVDGLLVGPRGQTAVIMSDDGVDQSGFARPSLSTTRPWTRCPETSRW